MTNLHPSSRESEYAHPPSGESYGEKAEFGELLTFTSHGEGYTSEQMRLQIDLIGRRSDSFMYDAHFTNDLDGIYAVADGVGTQHGSDVASQTATQAFSEAVKQKKANLHAAKDDKQVRKILQTALKETDRAVWQAKIEAEIYVKEGATTLTSAVYLGGNRFAFVNIGDSAAFVVDPNGAITRMTTEQGSGRGIKNWMNGKGRPKKHLWEERIQDEIVISTVEPGSHIILLTDGLIGDTPEQRIDPRLYAEGLSGNSDYPEGEVYRLLHLPGEIYRDDHAVIREGVSKPKIDDATAVVIKVAENDQFVSPAPAPEVSPESTVSQRDRLRHFSKGILERANNVRTYTGTQLGRLDTVAANSWAQIESYKATRPSRNFEYKTPSKRKLAAIGGIALAAAGTFAAVKYGVDMPDFNMPDFSISDIVDSSVTDIEDVLSSNPFDSTVEGLAVPETAPQSITLNDTVSSPMEAWNEASSNTGFFSGTAYDQIAKATTGLAHDYKIGFDINTLRQQSPSFEASYHEYVGNVLQDNNLTWEQAAQLPAGSTLEIDGDHIHSFFDSQNITLPPVESPADSTSSQETIIHPALIASVIAAGAAASLGAWLAARRHKKRKNSTQAQG